MSFGHGAARRVDAPEPYRFNASEHWPEAYKSAKKSGNFSSVQNTDNAGSWAIPEIAVQSRKVVPFYAADASREEDVNIELSNLAARWQDETELLSSVTKIVMHPAYQRIIGYGAKALPFLLDMVRANDRYWFHALEAITGVNPAPEVGGIEAARAAWLQWAAENHSLG